uniref:Unclassified n=1 Tax=Fusarium clavum TaxID=2594811 RepID=W1IBB3_9HYPO|nr:unclassified [Fusarium clavum]CEF82618.1 unclassified [Fusarium clavum]
MLSPVRIRLALIPSSKEHKTVVMYIAQSYTFILCKPGAFLCCEI